jgi:hypothetical protein
VLARTTALPNTPRGPVELGLKGDEMKIALACLALALVCCAPIASMAQSAPKDEGETTESWQINVDRHVACKRREDAENLIHFVPGDLPTFQDYLLEVLLSGRCVVLKKGTQVVVSNRGVEGETIAVRRPNETEYLYVDRYAVGTK